MRAALDRLADALGVGGRVARRAPNRHLAAVVAAQRSEAVTLAFLECPSGVECELDRLADVLVGMPSRDCSGVLAEVNSGREAGCPPAWRTVWRVGGDSSTAVVWCRGDGAAFRPSDRPRAAAPCVCGSRPGRVHPGRGWEGRWLLVVVRYEQHPARIMSAEHQLATGPRALSRPDRAARGRNAREPHPRPPSTRRRALRRASRTSWRRWRLGCRNSPILDREVGSRFDETLPISCRQSGRAGC